MGKCHSKSMSQDVSIHGRTFSIICVDNGKTWHYDVCYDHDFVSALWQPDDEFVQFMFELQTDGSYKIKSTGGEVYLFDGCWASGSILKTLNGKDHKDDDHARFIVTKCMEGRYRIQTKATKRFLRLDENLFVSSLKNIADDQALFKLVEEGLPLDDRKYLIVCADDGKMWHYDVCYDHDFVSALWQPDDEFVRFMFELKTDGSYKIKSIGGRVYLFDGNSVSGSILKTLNGKAHQDDDHARFVVTKCMAGRYRIQTKVTKRFLRLDEDRMVSSLKNIEDDRAFFIFIEVQ